MGIMGEVADLVETSWCQGDLRRGAQSREAGDSFCAIGALAQRLAVRDGLVLGFDGESVMSAEVFKQYSALYEKTAGGPPEDYMSPEYDTWWDARTKMGHLDRTDTYTFVGSSLEGKALARAVITQYRERFGFTKEEAQDVLYRIENNDDTDIIYLFNDDSQTTREEVVALMRKVDADLSGEVAQ